MKLNLYEEQLFLQLEEQLFSPAEERLLTLRPQCWDGEKEEALQAIEDWAQLDIELDKKASSRKIQWAYRPEMRDPEIQFYFDEIFVEVETEDQARTLISAWRKKGILEDRLSRYQISIPEREYLRVKYP